MPLLETRIHQFFFSFRDRHQQPHSENVIVIKSPKPPLVLGPPPRLAYPLVVFLIRETEADEASHPDDTVGSRAEVRCTRNLGQTQLTMNAAKSDEISARLMLFAPRFRRFHNRPCLFAVRKALLVQYLQISRADSCRKAQRTEKVFRSIGPEEKWLQ